MPHADFYGLLLLFRHDYHTSRSSNRVQRRHSQKYQVAAIVAAKKVLRSGVQAFHAGLSGT